MENLEAPWVGAYYNKYRNYYYNCDRDFMTEEEDMSDLWKYDPDICDGDFCPMDCDRCPKADREEEEEEDD